MIETRSMLATRFKYGAKTQIDSNDGRALMLDDVQRYCPSIFAASAHESRSKRYAYIPTADVLRGLLAEGWGVYSATQAKTRDESKREFTKHMIRLRHVDHMSVRQTMLGRREGNADVNELIIINSHDGATAYQMLAGCFRFVCSNGLVVGTKIDEVRVRHSGNVRDEVVQGAFRMLDQFSVIEETKEGWKSLQLTAGEQNAFANAALAARFDAEDVNDAPVTAEQVLQPKRFDDRDNSLWTTFNRVQENLVDGGLRTRTANGRRTRTRAVAGIDSNVKLNKALWTLAEEMKKIKTA